jgi:hypothetical protein
VGEVDECACIGQIDPVENKAGMIYAAQLFKQWLSSECDTAFDKPIMVKSHLHWKQMLRQIGLGCSCGVNLQAPQFGLDRRVVECEAVE